MKQGLYKVLFQTPLGYGAGVVVLENGRIRGGDFAMYYTGTYSLKNGVFEANVSINPHTSVPSSVSVLGTTKADLKLQGNYSSDSASATGTSPQAPGITFSAQLTWLSE